MAKILIGFMGAGKSTVSRLLDPDFQDMDDIITEKIGMPIAAFFEKEGEDAFREIESETLSNLADSDSTVSTGGGVVESARNRDILAKNGETIYLKADFETLCITFGHFLLIIAVRNLKRFSIADRLSMRKPLILLLMLLVKHPKKLLRK